MLKKKTKEMLMAAQDQALRTENIKNKVDKQNVSPIYSFCVEREETINHVVVE